MHGVKGGVYLMKKYVRILPYILVLLCFIYIVLFLVIKNIYYFSSNTRGMENLQKEYLIANTHIPLELYYDKEETLDDESYKRYLTNHYEYTFLKLLSYKGYEDVNVEIELGEDTFDTSQMKATIEFGNLNEEQKRDVLSVAFMDVLVIASNIEQDKINIIIH